MQSALAHNGALHAAPRSLNSADSLPVLEAIEQATGALAGLLATGMTMREAAEVLLDATDPLTAADGIATCLTTDPVATVQGLATVFAKIDTDQPVWSGLMARLQTWDIHPLSVALAGLDAKRWPATVHLLAEKLGVREEADAWVNGLSYGFSFPSSLQSWPTNLKIIPVSVSIDSLTGTVLPDDLWIGGNLKIAAKEPFSLPEGLVVTGRLDLATAKGWNERLPDRCRIDNRIVSEVFKEYLTMDETGRHRAGGTSVKGWRRYKAHEAEQVALGVDLRSIRNRAWLERHAWQAL